MSPIFVTPNSSLVRVSNMYEKKKMASRILRMTKQLGCSLVRSDKIEVAKLVDLENRNMD